MLVCVFCLVVCHRTLSNISVLCYIFGESFFFYADGLKYDFPLCIISILRTEVNHFLGGDGAYLSVIGHLVYLTDNCCQVIWFESNMLFILPYLTCSSFCAHQPFVEL